MKILVINAGSSSLKYQLIDMDGENVLAKGICERIGAGGHMHGNTADGRKFDFDVEMPNHTVAFQQVKAVLTEGDCAVIASLDEIRAVGHRVVQGGATFNKSMLVDDTVIAGIDRLRDLAPLHNPAHLQGIRACQEVFGPNVPQVVVFDNAFHSTMPPEAYLYAIPYEYYEKYKIRRYGFHGTSHRYVSARCAELMGKNLEEIKCCSTQKSSSWRVVRSSSVTRSSNDSLMPSVARVSPTSATAWRMRARSCVICSTTCGRRTLIATYDPAFGASAGNGDAAAPMPVSASPTACGAMRARCTWAMDADPSGFSSMHENVSRTDALAIPRW